MLTSEQITARTTRAVVAATSAGRRLGLVVHEPRVLHDMFSVVVHLAPAPVVVRVPTVLSSAYAGSPATQTAQQRAELAVAGWLADRGHPVVPPSPLVPREAVRHNGFSMTFWQYVEEVRSDELDIPRGCELTAQLHAALRDYDGLELGFCTPFNSHIPGALAELEQRPDLLDPADLQRAQDEWSMLRKILASRAGFESAFRGVGVQTIHGDAPFYNTIRTVDGDKWSDFELVTSGPIESDLAMAGPDGLAAYNEAAARLGLRRTDERVLRVIEAAGLLATVACLAMVPQLPMLADAVRPAIDRWRAAAPLTSASWER